MPTTLLITGPRGIGKTATSQAVSDLLTSRGTPHALIDLDDICALSPCHPTDPLNHELGLANLTSLCANYRNAGAEIIVLAAPLRRDMAPRLAAATGVPEGDMAVVRLVAPEEIVRLRREGQGREQVAWKRGAVEDVDIGVAVSADAPLVDVAARALRELEEL
ncbi:hypothetical protein CspeluHIS016_0701740 [Cutaneotrichosporon spelunceum]|uniref:P-loop containing nucleoside triphosphate hydrolase protein n=1 Tax=Cutaneotrichosporon spelunceum TaxID=1672016 RepID=A0AAD3TYG2_9TREE|nr:hypothetical protein CspeluHIS016_0701740 [Cutaneotrichosporon spelunceum]